MKKTIYISIISLLAVFNQACKQETFDYQLYVPLVDEIDSIYFSTGATSLIADGRATLHFVVETFRTTKMTNANGDLVDSLVFVDYKKLPAGSIKVFHESEGEVGMTYATNSSALGTANFHVQVGNVRSESQTITLRNPPAPPEKTIVDVVFHVFELSNVDPGYDELSYQPVTDAHLEKAILYTNTIFGHEIGNDPNGANTNVEFRLATHGPSGNQLARPGYQLITYNASWKPATRAFYAPGDFTQRVNTTASYGWDPDKYLNIYIIPSGANNSMGNNTPKYQVVPAGGTSIPGIANILNSKEDLPVNSFYETYGLGIPRTLFFPGTERQIELAPFLGSYYGLIRTGLTSATATDYCEDTRKYLLSANEINSLLKISLDGMKFLANNAMDDNRYPSLRNSFTLDQVNRMRSVMAQSPNRAHGQTF